MNRAAASNESVTSITLIERVKARDTAAWNQFTNLYGPLVYRWARKSGLRDSDAAEVMQEVFRNVAVGIERFRKTKPSDTFRSWLFTITRTVVRKLCNRKLKQPDGSGDTDAQHQLQQVRDLADDEMDDATFDSEASLTHRSLHMVRNEFEDRTWKAFWRSVVDGQSASDIAQELGVKPGAVLQAKYRVLCRVREMLSDE